MPDFHVSGPGPALVTEEPHETPGSNGEEGFPLYDKGYGERNDGLGGHKVWVLG